MSICSNDNAERNLCNVSPATENVRSDGVDKPDMQKYLSAWLQKKCNLKWKFTTQPEIESNEYSSTHGSPSCCVRLHRDYVIDDASSASSPAKVSQ